LVSRLNQETRAPSLHVPGVDRTRCSLSLVSILDLGSPCRACLDFSLGSQECCDFLRTFFTSDSWSCSTLSDGKSHHRSLRARFHFIPCQLHFLRPIQLRPGKRWSHLSAWPVLLAHAVSSGLESSLRFQASIPFGSCVEYCRNSSRSILESPDQKTQGFLVQIAFPR
jgi:hypothetical protein